MSSKNNALLLAWAFPPAITGGVYRPLSWARYSSCKGWNLSVLAGPNTTSPSLPGLLLLENLPQEVDIWRINPNTAPRPSYKFFPRVDISLIDGLNMVKTAMHQLIDAPPKVIIASGPPFHSFIAAFYLSRIFGSKLVLDYRDEWTLCPFTIVNKGNWDIWWEKRCLKNADCVIFTTDAQLAHNRRTFATGQFASFSVIPNGWEPSDFVGAGTVEDLSTYANKTRRKATLSFIGALGDHTLPGPFLRMIEQVFIKRKDFQLDITLQFIGTKSHAAHQQLSEFAFQNNLITDEQVSKKVANSLMVNSSALLMFYGPDFSRYIPGKLYDYLASKQPIILIGNSGEVPTLLRNLGTGHIINNGDINTLEKVLDLLLKQEKTKSNQKVEKWLQLHTRENMASRFFNIIENL